MMKEVVRDIASGWLPIIGTLAFVLAFVLILLRVVFLPKKEIEYVENLPLEDDIEALGASDNDNTESRQ